MESGPEGEMAKLSPLPGIDESLCTCLLARKDMICNLTC